MRPFTDKQIELLRDFASQGLARLAIGDDAHHFVNDVRSNPNFPTLESLGDVGDHLVNQANERGDLSLRTLQLAPCYAVERLLTGTPDRDDDDSATDNQIDQEAATRSIRTLQLKRAGASLLQPLDDHVAKARSDHMEQRDKFADTTS